MPDTPDLRKLDAESKWAKSERFEPLSSSVAVYLMDYRWWLSADERYLTCFGPERKEPVQWGATDVTCRVLAGEEFPDLQGKTYTGPDYATDHNAAALVVAAMWKQYGGNNGLFMHYLAQEALVPLMKDYDGSASGPGAWFFMAWQYPDMICRAALKVVRK